MLALQTRGKVHARRGDHAEAQRLAREAVAIGDQIDLLNYVGDAYADLAEVLVLADEPAQAVEALTRAVQQYSEKGNLVSRDRALNRLAELTPHPPGGSAIFPT
jgi:tetratricopeptide (TPR) repeat protein